MDEKTNSKQKLADEEMEAVSGGYGNPYNGRAPKYMACPKCKAVMESATGTVFVCPKCRTIAVP